MVPWLEGRRRLGPRGAGPGLPPLTRPAHLLIFVVRLSVPGSLPSLRAPHLPSLLAPAHECSVAQPWLGRVAQAVRNQMTSRQEPDLSIPSPVIVFQHWGFAQAQERDSNMAGHVTSFKSLAEKT